MKGRFILSVKTGSKIQKANRTNKKPKKIFSLVFLFILGTLSLLKEFFRRQAY